MELLDYYRDNLQYIRELSAEFAAEFPKIAGRLRLSEFECEDPYIERLLEGTAFLSARVEKKLDEGYRAFLETVLNSVAPSVLYPIPAGAVIELDVNYGDENVRRARTLEAGAVFDAFIPTISTPCRFSTMEDVPFAPLRVTEAEYVTRNLTNLGINNAGGFSALRLKLASALPEPVSVPIDELRFYINLPEEDASALLRQIMHDRTAVYYRCTERDEFKPLDALTFDVPMSLGNKLLGGKLKGNVRGLRLLQNFLAYPAFFKFFSIKGTAPVFASPLSTVELVIMFTRREPALAHVKAGTLKLNCAPALNIFDKHSERVTVEPEKYDFHIFPDRTVMRDYEVVYVKKLEFYNELNEVLYHAAPFYDEDILSGKNQRNFFNQSRRKTLFDPKTTQRSSYGGTEVFVSFSSQTQKLEDAYQFSGDLVCTNRDLPLLLPPETRLVSHNPAVVRGTFIADPTRPDYSVIGKGDGSDFSKLSFVIFNISSLLWQNGNFPLADLKTMVRSYHIRSSEEMDEIVDGLVDIAGKPAVFRFFKRGGVFFEYGWEVRFTLDETAYAGTGYYIFGNIIAGILKSFTSINSLLEIQFFTRQSGHIATWKTFENV
jgi:type VI secretion system VasI/ImpG family protein